MNNTNELKIKLDCYALSYYKEIDKKFSLPKDVDIDNEQPVVKVSGLIKTDNFPIS